MKLSIAMTSYNGVRYIKEQLLSFANQTRKPDEIIICDDGSTDGTVEVIESFILTSPIKVTLFKNTSNLGYVKNFEKALSLCTGDIIFLSDQDDVWSIDKLSTIESLFTKNSSTLIITNDARICDENMNPTEYTKLGQNIKLGLAKTNFKTGCCTSFRRDLLQVVLPIPKEVSHDVWINRFGDFINSRIIHDEVLQFYRRHGKNSSNDITSSTSKLSFFRHVAFYGLKDSRVQWKNNISNNNLYLHRISESMKWFRENGKEAEILKVKNYLEAQSQIILKRIEITSLPRWKRFLSVLNFYFFSDYRNFSKWKSALKDILRP